MDILNNITHMGLNIIEKIEALIQENCLHHILYRLVSKVLCNTLIEHIRPRLGTFDIFRSSHQCVDCSLLFWVVYKYATLDIEMTMQQFLIVYWLINLCKQQTHTHTHTTSISNDVDSWPRVILCWSTWWPVKRSIASAFAGFIVDYWTNCGLLLCIERPAAAAWISFKYFGCWASPAFVTRWVQQQLPDPVSYFYTDVQINRCYGCIVSLLGFSMNKTGILLYSAQSAIYTQ